MMGGAGGAGGDKPQERERQTWLSEDEKVWGTGIRIGAGVIGRTAEDDFDAEEAIVLPGPSRGHRPTDVRRPKPADQVTANGDSAAEAQAGSST